MEYSREAFEQVNVLRLQTAARMAGLRFRNGEKTKNQIIDDLMRYPSIGRACAANLTHTENAPIPKPAMTWDDPDEASIPFIPPTPTPATSPGEIYTPLRTHQILAADVARNALQAAEQTKALVQEAARHAGLLAALRKQIEDLQERRPVEFRFNGAPESHRPEGLTHPRLPSILRAFIAGENVMLVGPASSGKTTAAKQVAEALSKHFNRPDYECIASGAVADSFALIGYKNAGGLYVSPEFRRAVEFGHLFLFDEVDASAADALLVINALDNGFIAFPDRVVPLHPHFRLLTGANTDGSGATMEYSGRSRMDGAFRDRFLIIDWDIDPRIEEFLSRGDALWLEAVRAIRAFAKQREIMDVVATARATRRGPLLLAQGESRTVILEMTCKRGSLRDCWADVLRLPAVAAYLKG